ncbi:alpha/beta fold hydrolase [Aeromicrobium sp. Leaf350]|uniref:alpha/beta fold hydrolase n=1 Tax=Aeromicrobium sp. Leaf350 TaxID=2876565 RepID=UPI001E384727|nr:alpha/beta hydrolase [Aeromicrobium sp. Leaf350]
MNHDANPAPTVLMISGAGLPDWIWELTRARLAPHHATVVAPRPDAREASPELHARAALGSATGDLVLVAHSAGAVVAHEVVRLAPKRVRSVLVVSGVVPKAGGSFVSAMPAPQRFLLPLVLRLAGTRPPESAVRRGIGAGLAEDLQDRLVRDLVPESVAYFLDQTGGAVERPRTGYVTTSQDRELSPALQARFADRVGASWSRELTTGHLPMLEAPAELAAAIEDFVAVA